MGGRKGGKPDFTCMHLQILLLWAPPGGVCMHRMFLAHHEGMYIHCMPTVEEPAQRADMPWSRSDSAAPGP